MSIYACSRFRLGLLCPTPGDEPPPSGSHAKAQDEAANPWRQSQKALSKMEPVVVVPSQAFRTG